MTVIAQRLAYLRDRIDGAAKSAGRDPVSVTLVAVSKRQTADAIREAYAAGQRDFGENYAQELAAKRAELADLADIQWHFIGAVQSNKAKLLVPGTALIHAVDRLSAAEALSRRAAGDVSVLIEVNVGGEQSKSGVLPAALGDLLRAVSQLPSVHVRGLMCIPPHGAPETTRPFFRQLRTLRDDYAGEFPHLTVLSMGMSGDFEAAIAEGATHVRVGTAIFGERPHREPA